MRAAALALLACALPTVAHADDGRCDITYVSVPDGIKDVIERWVAAEPQCRGTIALRVIPTKDGLFLFAERPDGTVHERMVPDLTAAGVLVASWVADPWRIERTRKKKKRELEVRAVAVATPVVDGETRVENEVVARRRASSRKRWVSLGTTIVAGAEGADLGFRLEADMIMFRGWKLGIAAQKAQDTLRIGTNSGMQQGQVNDWSVGAMVSRTLRWRGWELRGGAGIYALGSQLHTDDFYQSSDGTPIYTYEIDASTAYELSAMLARDIGDRWGIALSAATMFISQQWHGNDNMTWYEKTTSTRKHAQTIYTVSLRRRI